MLGVFGHTARGWLFRPGFKTSEPLSQRVDTACKALYDDAPNGCPFGRLAQGLEHLPYTQGVVGSNPPPPTIFPEHLTAGS